MTAPLVWLLLSALAVIAPPAPTGPAAWQGAPPVVVARPSQPVSGHEMKVLVALLPKSAFIASCLTPRRGHRHDGPLTVR